MNWIHSNDLKRDKLLWEDIITIDVNENLPFNRKPVYSSHIIRLYENKNNEKYFLFIQPGECDANFDSKERGSEWLEYSLKHSSWGKFIMNYNAPHYQSLREIIKFDDDTKFYCVYGVDLNNLQESLYEQDILPLAAEYRH
ncbi:hypothetical protein [Sedimentibacter sp.]|uniref:hypothetical protein n=1 Tax=Sedimentibacter sp. TaxID=1960295 RepID=UPI00289ABBBB|nr:hypothetical protein [Sedimentibacter sp.]